jgi:hypothetical protein
MTRRFAVRFASFLLIVMQVRRVLDLNLNWGHGPAGAVLCQAVCPRMVVRVLCVSCRDIDIPLIGAKNSARRTSYSRRQNLFYSTYSTVLMVLYGYSTSRYE